MLCLLLTLFCRQEEKRRDVSIARMFCLCYKVANGLSIVTTKTLQALSNQKPQESPKIIT